VPYAGTLQAWCESREGCIATPLTTVLVELMDHHGFTAADARAYLADRLGFAGDPFSDTTIPTAQFVLSDARAALDHGNGLAAWVARFIAWLQDGGTPPEGIPTPAPEPAPASYIISTSAGGGGSISPVSVTVNHGATTSFTVTPDAGYGIDTVIGCGGSLVGNTYTTGAVTADCAVSVTFALPVVSLANNTVLEGNSTTTKLTFTVSLSTQAIGNVTVDYVTSNSNSTATGGSACGGGVDYLTSSGTLTISSSTTSNTVVVTVCGDTDFEPNETLTLTLSNVSANATLGTATATGTIANDDPGGLNDTGITACRDYAYVPGSGIHNNVDCAAAGATQTVNGTETANGLDPVPAGQDAHYGRDANPLTNDDADGHAGFSFTKLDASGTPLADQSANYATTPWSCVLDNVTGLMWEVKMNDNANLHHKDWTYTWYNSNAASYGGSVGTAAGGSCGGMVAAGCDTEKFVVAVNAVTLCGHDDWRLPNPEELQSIADLSRANPAIDTGFFPNTETWWYWSSSLSEPDRLGSWAVAFSSGNSNDSWIGGGFFAAHVRLVRAAQ